MIRALVRTSVRSPWWTIFAVLLALLGALRLAAGLRVDAFPDLTNVQVAVLTTSPGLGTTELEQLVTVPLERGLSGAPGLAELRSLSRPGISAITAVFEDGTDPWRARQVIAERVAAAADAVPPTAGRPEIAPPTTGLGEVLQFVLTADDLAAHELYRVFERDVAPRLRTVPGVVEVNAWGAGSPQLRVEADPFELAARGVPLSELEASLTSAVGLVSGGWRPVGAGEEQGAVRAVANPVDPAALAAVVVRPADPHTGAPPIRVGDVATVGRAGGVPVGLGTANGQGEALFGMVQLLAGGDALTVVRDAREALDQLAEGLPEGVHVEVVYSRDKLVGATLATVTRSLAEGGLLVIVVLLALLGDLRAGLIVASVIPMALAGALAALRLVGVSGNLMSLGAVDFGLVVDGTVVVVEGLVALQAGAWSKVEREAAFEERIASLTRPVLFAVGILLVVYAPIVLMGGTEGKLFRPMALTVLFALTTALALSLTWVPALASLALRPKGHHVPRGVAALARAHRTTLDAVSRRPREAFLAAAALTAVSVALGAGLGVTFVPRLEEGDLVLQTERLPGTSPEAATRSNLAVERALSRFPEVLAVASRTGSHAVATDPMGLGESDVLMALAPRDTWTSAHDLEGLTSAMAAAVRAADPAAALTFTQPIEMRFNELLEGVPSDVGVVIYGRDLDAMLAAGQRVAERLRAIPGAADVRAPSVEGLAVTELRVDPDALARLGPLGLSAADALAVVEAVQTGRVVTSVIDGEFRDDVVLALKLPPHLPLADLPVTLRREGDGATSVPLSELGDLVETTMPAVIRRSEGSRRVIVQANVRGRDLGGFVTDVERALVELPPAEGTWYALVGRYEQLREATAQLQVLVPVVLVTILALLRAAFGGFRAAWLIFLNVPVATSGGLLTLWAASLPLSLSAIVGFIALSGIAVMNGIVLVSRVLERLRFEAPPEAARAAAAERFRPVLTTATVAGLGFVPMALAHGVGAEVQRPLALVVIGGLLTSTALTLWLLPGWAGRVLRKEDAQPTA